MRKSTDELQKGRSPEVPPIREKCKDPIHSTTQVRPQPGENSLLKSMPSEYDEKQRVGDKIFWESTELVNSVCHYIVITRPPITYIRQTGRCESVPKKDGSWCPCGDFDALTTSLVLTDRNLMRHIEDIFCRLVGKRVFSKVDLLHLIKFQQERKQMSAILPVSLNLS